jgi:hypothetical protein
MPMRFTEFFPDSEDFLGHLACYRDKVVSDGMTRADRHFRNMVSDVFHHHATRNYTEPKERRNIEASPDDPLRLVQRDDITAMFRESFMSEFRISATPNEMEDDIADRMVSFDDFFDQVTVPSAQAGQTNPGSNYLSFVTGNVGHGKSLLMMKLLDTIEERNGSRPSKGLRCLPIYIDLEAAWGHHEGEFKDIDASFHQMIYERVEDAALQHDLPYAEFSKRHGSALVSDSPAIRLKNLCRWLPEKRYYALFILDNVDRFHFAHTRYSYFDAYRHKQIHSVQTNFLKLYRDFQDEKYLGALSATIIIVCRKDVFDYSRQAYDGAELRLTGKEPVFQVLQVDPVEIVRKRVALLGKVIESVRHSMSSADVARYEKAKSILDRAMQAAEALPGQDDPPLPVLRYICDLCHQGLRSLLEFLTQLEVDGWEDCEVLARVLEISPRNLLRMYVTNMRKRFRQSQNHFPNLFLNDCRANPDADYPEAHQGHKQTYWLKFLILKIIQAHRNQCIEFRALHRFLCEICGYEEGLVRLMVGILSSPHSFKCIDIKYEGKEIVQRRLHLSTRGKLLLGDPGGENYLHREPLCFSLDYLQLVIDDPWLRYPAPWAEHIALPTVHIGYTLKPVQRYRSDGLAYLKKKIPATLRFLRVLEASWNSEHRRIAALPDWLLQKIVPDFEEIGSRLMNGVGKVLSTYEGGEGIHSEMRDSWRQLREDREFDQWWMRFRHENPDVSR